MLNRELFLHTVDGGEAADDTISISKTTGTKACRRRPGEIDFNSKILHRGRNAH